MLILMFLILGLSDKLPPTPDSSPSKFPALGRVTGKILPAVVEGTREDTISQDSGVGSSNHPNEFSPQPQVDDHSFGEFSGCDPNILKVNSEPSDAVASVRNDDGDCGFADFQSFSTSVADEPLSSQEPEPTTLSLANSNIDQADDETSSQVFPTAPECSENSGKRSSRNSFSMIGTPPPLDYVVNNVIQGDEFSYISSNHTADSDDDFGDFASSKVSEVECSFPDNVGDNESAPVPSDKENGTLQGSGKDKENFLLNCKGSQLDSVRSADIFHVTSKPNKVSGDIDFGAQDALHLDKSVDAVGVVTESVRLCTSICNEFSSHVSKTHKDDILNPEKELLDDKGNKTFTEAPRTSLETEINISADKKDEDFGHFSSVSASEKINDTLKDVNNFRDIQDSPHIKVTNSQENIDVHLKTEVEDQLEINKVVNDNWTDCKSISFKSESEGKKKNSRKCTVSESCVSACNNVDVSSDVRRDERTAKEEKDCDKLYNVMVVKEQYGNSDSGDLRKADSLSESDFGDFSKADDDDLDFADLREQVENGTFGAEESVHPVPKDISEFRESNTNAEDVEDEFGGFKAPTTTVIDNEFGDFDGANVNESDEFGDFAVHDKGSVPESLTCSQNSHHEDDFGDFNDPTSARGFGDCSLAGGERGTGMGDFSTSWNENSIEPSSKTSPVLRKVWKTHI